MTERWERGHKGQGELDGTAQVIARCRRGE